ncbi:MAG TPA: hypothetical protein VKY92_08860 [Verrucomicrobiae bacterium]|nr:hypothetical protein [Verrucomicrobiae bacterium]
MNQRDENSGATKGIGHCRATKPLGMLLGAMVMGQVVAAQAEAWTFKIVNAPIALNKNSPKYESIRLTGGGTFDPATGVASASGTYTLFNAFDHPNGPVINATWHSSTFIGWVPDQKDRGMLTIDFQSSDPLANPNGPGQIVLMAEGVSGPIVAGEPYIVPPGGSGGSVRFEEAEHSFFPGAPAAAQWAFSLHDSLNAVIADSDHGEAMTLTGLGNFDTGANTAQASGNFEIVGAPDEHGGPTFHGTWSATSFDTFLPSGGRGEEQQGGTLFLTVNFNFSSGATVRGVKLTVIRPFVDGHFQDNYDAVNVQLTHTELFTRPADGAGGKVRFQLLDR